MAGAFPRGKPTVVLQARLDEEVNHAVRHINNILDGLLGLVIIGKEGQFVHEFGVDGLLDKPEQGFRLWCHVDESVPVGRVVLHGHPSLLVHRALHKRHQRTGERFQRPVVVSQVLQHGRRHREDNTRRRERPSRKDVVDQESVDAAVTVLERMQKDESIRHDGGVDHGRHSSLVHPPVGGDQSLHQALQISRLAGLPLRVPP